MACPIKRVCGRLKKEKCILAAVCGTNAPQNGIAENTRNHFKADVSAYEKILSSCFEKDPRV